MHSYDFQTVKETEQTQNKIKTRLANTHSHKKVYGGRKKKKISILPFIAYLEELNHYTP